MSSLALRGFSPSCVVAPSRPGPRPVIVLLHGTRASQSGECRTWGGASRSVGWLLGPAGERVPEAPPGSDLWTYGRVRRLAAEIRAGLQALKRRHPDRVASDDLVLIGFSLGARVAPALAAYSGLPFRALVLVEGVYRLRRPLALKIAQQGVRRVAYVCGERTSCLADVTRRLWYWRKVGVQTRIFVMPGAQHEYSASFTGLGAQVLGWARGGDRHRVTSRKPDPP